MTRINAYGKVLLQFITRGDRIICLFKFTYISKEIAGGKAHRVAEGFSCNFNSVPCGIRYYSAEHIKA